MVFVCSNTFLPSRTVYNNRSLYHKMILNKGLLHYLSLACIYSDIILIPKRYIFILTNSKEYLNEFEVWERAWLFVFLIPNLFKCVACML